MMAGLTRAGGPQGKLRALPPGLEPLDHDRPVTGASRRGQKGLVAGDMRLGVGAEFAGIPTHQLLDPCLYVERLILQAESQRAQATDFTRHRKPERCADQNIPGLAMMADPAPRHSRLS